MNRLIQIQTDALISKDGVVSTAGNPLKDSKLNNLRLPETLSFSRSHLLDLSVRTAAHIWFCVGLLWPWFLLSSSCRHASVPAVNEWNPSVGSEIDTIWGTRSRLWKNTSVRTLLNQISLDKQTSDSLCTSTCPCRPSLSCVYCVV